VKKGDVKVGIFVFVGVVLSGFVVFLIGSERRLFSSATEYRTRFADVQGLSKGAPVRMGGVRIGQVLDVTYGDPSDPSVHVRLEVVDEDAARVRSDSLAQIADKGLLGDKMIVITPGTKGDPIPPGGEIPAEDPKNLMDRFDRIAEQAESTMKDVSSVAGELADERLHEDIRESAHSLNVLLKQLTEGDGYPQRFINSAEEADRISRVVDGLDEASQELTVTLREVRGAVHRVRTGPGFAHDVLYGDGPSREIAQFGAAAEEVALVLRGIREGNGFAHDVLFGGDQNTQDAMSNITQMTADLRDIIRNVKNGKGTIGALLVDPSIYDDLKRVLGNVERNAVLRALVRYSIKRDEDREEPAVEADGE
jgi:phospholipid/cholesterol/gamma-HCH transport system substrate-binding protein